MDRPEPDLTLLNDEARAPLAEEPAPPLQAPAATEAPPSPVEAPIQRLDPRAVTLWRLHGGLWWAFWTVCMIIPWLLWEWPLWLMAPVAALGVVWVMEVPAAAYRHFAYQVGPVDVRVMHGWWTRRVAVVLHSRIQHVDTRQGPMERAMGLATVVVFTAGSVGAMVGIPGLAEADAEALRDRLAHLSGTDDAV